MYGIAYFFLYIVFGNINPDAVRVIKALYGVDMSETKNPRLLAELPKIDILVTLGCQVAYPFFPCRYREDWGLEDPTGKEKKAFLQTADMIKKKVLDLKNA